MLVDGIEYLTRSNFKLYCAKVYSNPDSPNLSTMESDLYNVSHVKRLISNYVERGEIKDRLILNHVIILGNIFGVQAAVRILFFRIDEEYYPVLKTFLKYLDFMPEVVTGLRKRIYDKQIEFDAALYQRLLDYEKSSVR